ncbi:MAG: type II toxin-antitoxin system HicA family toxin [Syntrophobacter sp.]
MSHSYRHRGRLGFTRVRQRSSHIRFAHSDGHRTTIPDQGQGSVPKGLLLNVLRDDLEMTLPELPRLLE